MRSNTKYTEQHILNQSFDETHQAIVMEQVARDGDSLVFVPYDPLAGYKISDIDDTGYYGYINTDGGWYIMSLISNQARYVKGDSAYSTAWTNRASQSYGYFNSVF